jgi:2,4-dienoyl-CoA reductase-like NADH-dependent reductase (Old Yellow Enzyme family)
MTTLFEPLSFVHGPTAKNRFALAPLTNMQSHVDGTLSDDEFRWLTLRAAGGFGLTMTCAANVSRGGPGVEGNLGIYANTHIDGVKRLAEDIKRQDSVAVMQLFHAGARAPIALTGQQPIGPSDDESSGVRGMSGADVEQMIEDFIAAARRAEKAGFDGVELHAAHGYLLSAFLSPELNRRQDQYGGSPENRARPIRTIITGIRQRCGSQFSLGLRLSAERFGVEVIDMQDLARDVMAEGAIDYLDMSLWDVFKEPAEERLQGRNLMSYFTELNRGKVRLGVAGKIMSGAHAAACLDAGADFVLIGRAAIAHHDFPKQVRKNPDFKSLSFPLEQAYLETQGVSPVFYDYLTGLLRYML